MQQHGRWCVALVQYNFLVRTSDRITRAPQQNQATGKVLLDDVHEEEQVQRDGDAPHEPHELQASQAQLEPKSSQLPERPMVVLRCAAANGKTLKEWLQVHRCKCGLRSTCSSWVDFRRYFD